MHFCSDGQCALCNMQCKLIVHSISNNITNVLETQFRRRKQMNLLLPFTVKNIAHLRKIPTNTQRK